MANPTRYQPSYSFTGWQASNPSRPLPAQMVDIEFQNLKLTTDEIITALGQVRRSDGKLFNGVVDLAALSDEVIQQLGGGGSGGSVIMATKAQAEAGTSNAVVMSPLRVKEAIAVFASDSGGGTGPGGPIAISDVTGLQTALDGKSQVGHTHAISAIGGLQAALDGKSPVGHAHNIGDVTGLDGTLDGLEQALASKEDKSAKGQAGGYAGLGSDGRVPADQLPVQPVGSDAKAPVYFEKTDELTTTRLFEREGVTAGTRAQKLVETKIPFNENRQREISAFHVRAVSEGSIQNGPEAATLGIGLSLFKEGFGTGTAKGGEIDGMYIVLRQDSPRDGSQEAPGTKSATRGDGCGILIDAAVYQNVGFVGGIEGNTSVLSNANGSVISAVAYQIGCVDTTTAGGTTGYFVSASKGEQGTGLAIYAAEGNGGYFREAIRYGNDSGAIFTVGRDGTVGLGRRLNNGTTINPSVHMAVQADYSLGWFNAGKTVQIMSLSQSGELTLYGGVSGSGLNATNHIQAGGNIIAGGNLKGRTLDLTLGGDGGSGGPIGRLFAGAGGKLRYYDGVYPTAREVQMVP